MEKERLHEDEFLRSDYVDLPTQKEISIRMHTLT